MIEMELRKSGDRIIIEVRENDKQNQNRGSVLSLTHIDLEDYEKVGKRIMEFGKQIINHKKDNMIICKVCNQYDNNIKFIKKDSYMGNNKLPVEFFRSSEYSFGWDYFAKYDIKKISCKCGFIWYEKIK